MAAVSQVSLLVNPRAGGGRAGPVSKAVVAYLRDLGVKIEVLAPTSPEGALEAARQVSAMGAERLLVVGGDGLIRLAASALAGGTTVLGVVAAGTGNDAARALRLLDGSLEEQVQWALADPVPIDLVVGSGQPVVTSAVCGFPTTVNERANRMRFPKAASRYTLATLLEIPRMAPAHYRLVLDGEALEIEAAAIVVANTAYFGGGMRICPEADPTDGVIDVCVIGDLGRLDLLRSLQQVRTGRHVDHPKVAMYRAGVVGVEGVGPVRADGEPLGDLPVVLRADPGALLVAGATTAAPGRR